MVSEIVEEMSMFPSLRGIDQFVSLYLDPSTHEFIVFSIAPINAFLLLIGPFVYKNLLNNPVM